MGAYLEDADPSKRYGFQLIRFRLIGKLLIDAFGWGKMSDDLFPTNLI